MTGSMYAAVSGLKSHMNALNVIGNNVSNVNTTAYKATRYTFNEALYTTQRSGSDGTNISGGRNPAQIGFGASIGTIDLDMSTKNYTPTGQLLDTMIDGDGFFFVGDKEIGDGASAVAVGDTNTLKGMNLTRLGNFNIDPNGFLVDGNGSVVWGFLDENVETPTMTIGNDGNISYSYTTTDTTGGSGGGATPTPTAVTIDPANINGDYYEIKDGDGNVTQKFRIFSFPNGNTKTYKFLTGLTEADVEQLKRDGINLHNIEYETVNVPRKNAAGEVIPNEFDKVSYVKSATETQNQAMGTIRLPTKDTASNTIKWPKYVKAKDATLNADGTVATPAEPAEFEDGAATRLQPDSVTIDEKSGALRVMTSDGKLYTIGYLAIGKVTNPNGVTHVDGRYYQAQDGAGEIRVTSVKEAVSGIESAGDTKLITGGLESSGTDLATEITNMITVQRGYQANTRIVTVTDSMLEELVNMKR